MTTRALAVSAMRGVRRGPVRPDISAPIRRADPEQRRDCDEEDHDPYSPEPVGHAPPEQYGGRLGLDVRKQRGPRGREPAHCLEGGVQKAMEGALDEERRTSQQGGERPGQRYGEVDVPIRHVLRCVAGGLERRKPTIPVPTISVAG